VADSSPDSDLPDTDPGPVDTDAAQGDDTDDGAPVDKDTVKEPGGCGCATGGSPAWGWVLLLALARARRPGARRAAEA
jgi:uncharacterized protein (TIGR03382 family)